MKENKTSKYTLTVWLNRLCTTIVALMACTVFSPSFAQDEDGTQPLMPGEKPKPTKYIAVEEQKQKLVFFQGFSLSVDAFGPISYFVSDYGTLEGALRLNLKNTYFPIAELGYAQSDIKDLNTNVCFNLKAPFLRIGADFNMLKNKFQENKLFIGFRYGISRYNYGISGPEMTDPIWGGSSPFDIDGIDCTSHWGEFVAGLQVKVTGTFHMGWIVRYKKELYSTKSDYAKPSYIPGYGSTKDTTCWGFTYNLVFDLNWGLKKSKKKGQIVEIRELNDADPLQNVDNANDNNIESSEPAENTENGQINTNGAE